MKTLIVGASGATGKQLVEQLLKQGSNVKVIVRPTSNIPETWQGNEKIEIIKANISELSIDEMANHLKDCQAVASCLGHNLTLKGLFGKPRKLVTGAVQLLCQAIQKNASAQPVKFVLMNTSGNRNRDLNEPITTKEKLAIGLLRFLVPPHSDNEQAADYLRLKVGQENKLIEWVAVRPDALTHENEVTPCEIHPSPIRSALFNPGKTSRINVGNFMARLISENDLWNEWKGQMPVVYNNEN